MIESRLANPEVHEMFGRRLMTGWLCGVEVVTAVSGYGKVAASATAACVIQVLGAATVLFGGVAGGVGPGIAIGDIVVADRLIQHDFDASPIFDRYVIPSLGTAEIATDPGLTEQITAAAERYVRNRAAGEMSAMPDQLFDVSKMRVHRGLVASGDQFISSTTAVASLLDALPDVLAVEMEGAAVAQVCAERDIPFAVFRLISDRADRDAEVDFMSFVSSVAAPLTAGITEEWASNLS